MKHKCKLKIVEIDKSQMLKIIKNKRKHDEIKLKKKKIGKIKCNVTKNLNIKYYKSRFQM